MEAFAENLARADTWLAPFRGFGPNNFLVGYPEFDFVAYRAWVEARFPPSRFHQLKDKMGTPTQYAIGSFIQALGQNPDPRRAPPPDAETTYIGTGVGDLPTICDVSIDPTTRSVDGTASGPTPPAIEPTGIGWQPGARRTACPPILLTPESTKRSDRKRLVALPGRAE
jgi:hypothetical protein